LIFFIFLQESARVPRLKPSELDAKEGRGEERTRREKKGKENNR
jgi:hypothetical protein